MDNKPFSHMNIETLMPSNNHNYNRNKILDVFTISDGKVKMVSMIKMERT